MGAWLTGKHIGITRKTVAQVVPLRCVPVYGPAFDQLAHAESVEDLIRRAVQVQPACWLGFLGCDVVHADDTGSSTWDND